MRRTARTLLLAWLVGLSTFGLALSSQAGVPTAANQELAAAPATVKPLIASGWARVPEILSRIKAPVFPARQFPITDFGAAADQADCTEAIRKAIGACADRKS